MTSRSSHNTHAVTLDFGRITVDRNVDGGHLAEKVKQFKHRKKGHLSLVTPTRGTLTYIVSFRFMKESFDYDDWLFNFSPK